MLYKAKFEELRDIYNIPEKSGFIETYMPDVHFFWSTEHVARAPLPFKQGIVIVGQGAKKGYLGGKEFSYDANNYLISSVMTAYECETLATETAPVLGILIQINPEKLNALREKVESYSKSFSYKGKDVYCGIEPVELDDAMQTAAIKLLKAH